jgi:hypothetical protein
MSNPFDEIEGPEIATVDHDDCDRVIEQMNNRSEAGIDGWAWAEANGMDVEALREVGHLFGEKIQPLLAKGLAKMLIVSQEDDSDRSVLDREWGEMMASFVSGCMTAIEFGWRLRENQERR